MNSIQKTPLVLKEMQIKLTLRSHVISFIIPIIKNSIMTNAGEDAGEKNPLYTVGGNVN
jgi:hypothetical protein